MSAEALSGTILIVDDEASLRRTLTRILRQAGCDVTAAADGPEALELLAKNRELEKEIDERRQVEDEVRRVNDELDRRVRERTADLKKAYEGVKKADQLKDSFLSSVSHELRTPLTSIRSFAEILLDYDDEKPATRKEFVEIIKVESERLARLINDFLDLSKIQAGI